MCVISNVMDGYNPFFPPRVPAPSEPVDWPQIFAPAPAPDLTEMRKLIDALMKQPDCIDPDKAKLLERVERLEKIIDALLAQRASTP